jgi:hypothetical protein
MGLVDEQLVPDVLAAVPKTAVVCVLGYCAAWIPQDHSNCNEVPFLVCTFAAVKL